MKNKLLKKNKHLKNSDLFKITPLLYLSDPIDKQDETILYYDKSKVHQTNMYLLITPKKSICRDI